MFEISFNYIFYCLVHSFIDLFIRSYFNQSFTYLFIDLTLFNRYNRATGITFASLYPGCIAESPLFREKRAWFRKYFPVFMKYITGGYVSESEAGQRLFQAITDHRCAKSGVYWVRYCFFSSFNIFYDFLIDFIVMERRPSCWSWC